MESLIESIVQRRMNELKDALIEDLYSPDGKGVMRAIERLNSKIIY
jgi:DNA-directed RNA polymerase specialized sigma subunit